MMKIFSIRLSENSTRKRTNARPAALLTRAVRTLENEKKFKKKIDSNQVDFAPFFYWRKGLFVESSR